MEYFHDSRYGCLGPCYIGSELSHIAWNESYQSILVLLTCRNAISVYVYWAQYVDSKQMAKACTNATYEG